MTPSQELPGEVLEDIAFLTRSENRMKVLLALTAEITASGRPSPSLPRRDLETMTDTPRTTLSRIISEFEDRGWIDRNNDAEYVATHRGQHLAIQMEPLLDSLETIHELGEDIAMFPVTELSCGPGDGVVSLQEFDDVTVHRPGARNPTLVNEYLAETLHSATTEHYSFAFMAPPNEYVAAAQEVCPDLDTFHGVYAGSLIDWYPSEMRSKVREDVLNEGGRVFRYDGHMPCQLFIIDDTVLIENSQVEHIPIGTFIETQNDTVREWALDLFERYRQESTELTVEDLAE